MCTRMPKKRTTQNERVKKTFSDLQIGAFRYPQRFASAFCSVRLVDDVLKCNISTTGNTEEHRGAQRFEVSSVYLRAPPW